MKWFHRFEKRLFPKDSPYQRARRRRLILFYAVVFVTVFVGAIAFTKFSSRSAGIPSGRVRARALTP